MTMILYEIKTQKAQVRIRSTNQILTSFMIFMIRPDLRSMIHDVMAQENGPIPKHQKSQPSQQNMAKAGKLLAPWT